MWSYDPESYTGGTVATGRDSHAGQVKGDDPDKNRYPGPPGWVLGVRLTTPLCKKNTVMKPTQGCRVDDGDDHRMSLSNGTVFHEKLTVIQPIMKFRTLMTS